PDTQPRNGVGAGGSGVGCGGESSCAHRRRRILVGRDGPKRILPRGGWAAGESSGKNPARSLSLAMEAAAHVRQTDHRDGERMVFRRGFLAAGGMRSGYRGRKGDFWPVRNQLGNSSRQSGQQSGGGTE